MQSEIFWDNKKLEPVLVTYNRSENLEDTLNAFIKAGLTDIKLHILDNASTDNTREVVSMVKDSWPNLTYHRNHYNIGGNANIMRAVELTSSEYSWIIGDDDEWFLENINELKAVLQKAQADIIRLGWLVSPKSRGKYTEAIQLVKNDQLFFASVSMISATIVRRSIITKSLPYAYMAIGDSYPQLISILRVLTSQPLQVYSLSKDIVLHTPSTVPGYFAGDLEWYNGWFRTSRFIKDKDLRECFINDIFVYITRDGSKIRNEFLWLLIVVLNFKALEVNQMPYLLNMLAYGKGWRCRLLIITSCYLMMPTFIAKWARKFAFRVSGRTDKGLRVDKSRI
ncbi:MULTISPECIES: glycosyltransferase family 2 protein [Methylotenera]|uniref:glycosyltransferase family 2 protein n=1 Tax=Methylotenera TaxID=359407 RepID=UPI00039BBA39|nr:MULTISPECIES: glycosyltransferase family 2 protein [Methylotenera]